MFEFEANDEVIVVCVIEDLDVVALLRGFYSEGLDVFCIAVFLLEGERLGIFLELCEILDLFDEIRVGDNILLAETNLQITETLLRKLPPHLSINHPHRLLPIPTPHIITLLTHIFSREWPCIEVLGVFLADTAVNKKVERATVVEVVEEFVPGEVHGGAPDVVAEAEVAVEGGWGGGGVLGVLGWRRWGR